MTQILINIIVFIISLLAFLHYDFPKMAKADAKHFVVFVALNSFLLLATGWELLKLFF